MRMVIVSVRDKKAEFFSPVYAVPTKGLAIRGFGDAIMKGGSDLSSHPEDFSLFMVGEFDQVTGMLIPCEPVSICTGLDFSKPNYELEDENGN